MKLHPKTVYEATVFLKSPETLEGVCEILRFSCLFQKPGIFQTGLRKKSVLDWAGDVKERASIAGRYLPAASRG